MENATKALTIAASILIAIILITLIVVFFKSTNLLKTTEARSEETRQLKEFNEQYSKYKGKYLYGTEVITIINRAIGDGVKVTINNMTQTIGKENKVIGDYIEEFTPFAGNAYSVKNINTYKDNRYKCTNVEYTNGKVSKIIFKEID